MTITKEIVNWMNQIYFVNVKCYRPYVDTLLNKQRKTNTGSRHLLPEMLC